MWVPLAAVLWLVALALRLDFVQPAKFFGKSDFKWVNLSSSEMTDWYTPADHCVMENLVRSAYPQDIRSKDCAQYSKGSRRMMCGVGMGNNNNPCFGPFGEARPSFRRGIEGYTNYSSKPLTEALKTLVRANATLVLAGDSTTRQKLQALYCELTRENPGIRTRGNIFGIVPCDTPLWIDFRDGHTMTIYTVSMGPQMEGKCNPELPSPTNVAAAQHLARIVHKINMVENTSVLLIANMGLWYNDEDLFRKSAPPVLDYLSTLPAVPGRVNTVAWHETLAQHWISSSGSGYFKKELVDNQEKEWDIAALANHSVTADSTFMVPKCCARITNYTLAGDWRNAVVHELLDSTPRFRKSIHLLPVAGLTRDVPDMHTCNPYYKHDCTHYCFWPLMWQVLWHQIQQLSELLEQAAKIGK